jgi:Holliday junction DNA helicase RuvB
MDTTHSNLTWDDFVGQDDIKRRLDIRIQAAVSNGRPLPHVLLTASPGHGKTTLAQLIAKRTGGTFRPMVAPVVKQTVHTIVQEHQDEPLTIFIDEIHLMPRREQEEYLTLLEEGFIEYGDERVYHDHLTVIAGTTKREAVIPALYDRFPIKPIFEDYTDETLISVVEGFAERLDVALTEVLTAAIARAAGGVPRIARGLVEAARDLDGTDYTAADVLDLVGIEEDGLNLDQLRYLRTLASVSNGRMGIGSLGARIHLSPTTVQDQVEPLLIKRGYIEQFPSGRAITVAGRERVA